jgi:hypothetical protein
MRQASTFRLRAQHAPDLHRLGDVDRAALHHPPHAIFADARLVQRPQRRANRAEACKQQRRARIATPPHKAARAGVNNREQPGDAGDDQTTSAGEREPRGEQLARDEGQGEVNERLLLGAEPREAEAAGHRPTLLD